MDIEHYDVSMEETIASVSLPTDDDFFELPTELKYEIDLPSAAVPPFVKLLPPPLRRDTIQTEVIAIDAEREHLVALTGDGRLHEVVNRNIIALLYLWESGSHAQSPPELAVCYLSSSSNKRRRQIFIIVLSDTTLYIVRRTDAGLELSRTYSNVQQFKPVDPDQSGLIRLELTKIDKADADAHAQVEVVDLTETRNISDSKCRDEHSFAELSSSVLAEMDKVINSQRAELVDATRILCMVRQRGENELCTLPMEIRGEELVERMPLAQAGPIWVKYFNEQVVIGVPVVNGSYTSCVPLENVRPYIGWTEDTALHYAYNLYKLRDDGLTFDELDTLTADIGEVTVESDVPPFQTEWTHTDHHNTLQPESNGVVVILMSVPDFVDMEKREYRVYIDYDVTPLNATRCRLQLFAGTVQLRPEFLCDPNYQLNFDKVTVYRDLLVVSAASTCCGFTLSWCDASTATPLAPHVEQYLSETLEFVPVENCCEKQRTKELEYFWSNAAHNGYFGGMMLRVNKPDIGTMRIKIYGKTVNHVFALVRLIQTELGAKCELIPLDLEVKHKRRHFNELCRLLHEELTVHWNYHRTTERDMAFFRQLFVKELNTDIAYANYLFYEL